MYGLCVYFDDIEQLVLFWVVQYYINRADLDIFVLNIWDKYQVSNIKIRFHFCFKAEQFNIFY